MKSITVQPIIDGQAQEQFNGVELYFKLQQRGYGDFVLPNSDGGLSKVEGFRISDGDRTEDFKGIDEMNEFLRACAWGDDPHRAGNLALDCREQYGKNATLEFMAGKLFNDYGVRFPHIGMEFSQRYLKENPINATPTVQDKANKLVNFDKGNKDTMNKGMDM